MDKAADTYIIRDENDEELSCLKQKITYLEKYDTLTGLPNRNHLIERLCGIVSADKKVPFRHALLSVDIDGFRKLNDMYGYQTGDEILRIAAKKLKSALRDNDMVARIQNDEFIVHLAGFNSLDDITAIADRILSHFDDRWVLSEHEFYITSSIGIFIIPEGAHDVADILRSAANALYKAKSQGKNQYQFHEHSISENLVHSFRLENSLRNAVNRDEITVNYQPQVLAENGQITGVEALVRWNHPKIGTILPGSFIPMAEDTGLVIPVGKRVFELVCRDYITWKGKGYGQFSIAVNISAKQLQQKGFTDYIKVILNETGINPLSLEFEITESDFVKSMKSAVDVMFKLKDMGIMLSLDDFGTGYCSLSYLKDFPVDKLKIDRSFIADIGKNHKAEAIITAEIVLARKMKLDIIAEGVESLEQLDFLVKNGCYHMQGYLYSKPLAGNEITKLLCESFIRIDRNPGFLYQI